jgi:GntR family transcriptional regulator/MocR family aminotransferase
VRTAKFVTDWHTTLPAQAALARFIDEGYLARHVRKMRQVYQVRHRLLSTGLRDLLGDRLEVLPSAAGLHLTALAPGMSCADIDAALHRAEAAGAELQPLSMYDVGSPGGPGSYPATAPSPPNASRRGSWCCGDASVPERTAPAGHRGHPVRQQVGVDPLQVRSWVDAKLVG